MSLKLLIDTESQRVLFAEADKEFIDFLFHILRLPLGIIIPLLEKQGMVGSFGNIYKSIENWSSTYLQPNVNKDTLLKHKVLISGGTGEVPLLLPNVESLTPKKFYRCSKLSYNNCYTYVADNCSAICPLCNGSMSHEQIFVDPPSATNTGSSSEEGNVKGVVTYMVMDDLEVKPMSTISSITLLNKFNVKEVRSLEEKVVELGMDEVCRSLLAFCAHSILCI